jgi:hypothetical protein
MKRKWAFMATLIIMLSLLFSALPAQAQTGNPIYGFECISGEVPEACDIGEAQLAVEVYLATDYANTVVFRIINNPGENSSVAEVYFDDGMLIEDTIFIYGEYPDEDVNFYASDANPPVLPDGQNAVPPFVVTDAFLADAGNNAPVDGINPGEYLELAIQFYDPPGYDGVISALESGDLRIGVHVVAFDNGDSASFVTTGDPPTLIELISFGATSAIDSTNLGWITGSEVDNAGFNIYRSLSSNGPFVKVNSALIPAEGDPVAGASYSYADSALALGTYYYLLEDVDLYGVVTRHGPVSASALPSLRRPILRPVISW